MKKCFIKVLRVFFFVLEWFGTSFQRFFLSLNGSKQNNNVPKCFSPLRNGLERNMEHFYLLQNGSERNYEVPSVQNGLLRN